MAAALDMYDPRPRRDGHAHLFVTLVVFVGLLLGD
jgi:hypothetical protein